MAKMMGRYFYRREGTLDERIKDVWERQELKQVLAKWAVFIFNNTRSAELANLWVEEPENQKTAQFGSNWGYYVGLDSIKHYYEKAYPAGADGYCYHVPNSTNVIHIAADGLTAYCVMYCMSARAFDTDKGVRGYDLFDHIWFDMKKEEGGWKIWHVFVGNDVSFENGASIVGKPALAFEDPERVNPCELSFGTPDYPLNAYDPKFGWYDFPRIPDAHDGYSLDMSCSLEACLKFLADRSLTKGVKTIYEALGGAGK